MAAQAKLSGEEPGSARGRAMEHSAWNRIHGNVLCGAGVTSEAGISFMEPESEPLIFLPVSDPCQRFGVGVGITTLCPGPESGLPGHLNRNGKIQNVVEILMEF